MNNNSANSIKKIKVNFEYMGKSMETEIEPYRNIGYLKEKAKKMFFIINVEYKIIHSNKDLTPFESITLGDYFKNKSKIQVKVIQTSNLNYLKEINPDSNNLNFNEMKNIEKNFFEIENKIGYNNINLSLNNSDSNQDITTLNAEVKEKNIDLNNDLESLNIKNKTINKDYEKNTQQKNLESEKNKKGKNFSSYYFFTG